MTVPMKIQKEEPGFGPRFAPRVDHPTILLVEDEVLVRMAIAAKFREAGYCVIESTSADEALVVLRSGTNVNVVFSDVRLPGSIDGIALAQLVRSELPAIKIVLASGQHRASNSAEHDGFFPKPYDADSVIACVRKLAP